LLDKALENRPHAHFTFQVEASLFTLHKLDGRDIDRKGSDKFSTGLKSTYIDPG